MCFIYYTGYLKSNTLVSNSIPVREQNYKTIDLMMKQYYFQEYSEYIWQKKTCEIPVVTLQGDYSIRVWEMKF